MTRPAQGVFSLPRRAADRRIVGKGVYPRHFPGRKFVSARRWEKRAQLARRRREAEGITSRYVFPRFEFYLV